MLAGVTIVDPRRDLDRADASSSSRTRSSTRSRSCAARPASATGAEVGPHVVAVDATIGAGALVGPFCYLRPGTVLEPGSKAGTFVEIKNSRIGERTKVPHLSYVGDAEIGAETNIAAGNITANFPHQPGRPKGRTTIGRNVRTGVQNAFVAPVEVGDDCMDCGGHGDHRRRAARSRWPGSRREQVTKVGYVEGGSVESATTELASAAARARRRGGDARA